MIDIIKHMEFFNPWEMKETIHIIGLGAIGSHIAEELARLGCENFRLYDMDRVTGHNLANQVFNADQINTAKILATATNMWAINQDITIAMQDTGWHGQPLAGYVFLCVDNIDLRREIAERNKYNANVKAMFDCRMRLSDAQHYAADWSKPKDVEQFLASMAFTHDEAKEATPVSACGTTLSVLPTVKMITALCVANFINFVKGAGLKRTILVDAFAFDILAM